MWGASLSFEDSIALKTVAVMLIVDSGKCVVKYVLGKKTSDVGKDLFIIYYSRLMVTFSKV